MVNLKLGDRRPASLANHNHARIVTNGSSAGLRCAVRRAANEYQWTDGGRYRFGGSFCALTTTDRRALDDDGPKSSKQCCRSAVEASTVVLSTFSVQKEVF
jgi:hypothetical protein